MGGLITESELEQRYRDMLDDCHDTVEVAGMRYDTSRVLRECDPIAYRVGMSDYADALVQDGEIDGVEGWQ